MAPEVGIERFHQDQPERKAGKHESENTLMTINDTHTPDITQDLDDPFADTIAEVPSTETRQGELSLPAEAGNSSLKTEPGNSPWTTIGRKDVDGLKAFVQTVGLSEDAAARVQECLNGEVITSKSVALLDITAGLDGYEYMFEGHVTIGGLGQTVQIPRGFTFKEGDQHIILAKFETNTKLKEPDENGISYGKRHVLHVLFPDTSPGFKGANGRAMMIAGQLASYRPNLRLMIDRYYDDKKKPLWARFPSTPRSSATTHFDSQLPEYIYRAALEAGATREELLVSEMSRNEEEERVNEKRNSARMINEAQGIPFVRSERTAGAFS